MPVTRMVGWGICKAILCFICVRHTCILQKGATMPLLEMVSNLEHRAYGVCSMPEMHRRLRRSQQVCVFTDVYIARAGYCIVLRRHVAGSIPTGWGTNDSLTAVTTIDLSYSQLSGTIPAWQDRWDQVVCCTRLARAPCGKGRPADNHDSMFVARCIASCSNILLLGSGTSGWAGMHSSFLFHSSGAYCFGHMHRP